MKTISHVAVFVLVAISTASAEENTHELPATWLEDPIEITIHGLFRVDEKTKEGWVGKDEDQYKLLITYRNTSQERYESSMSVFETSPGVGYLRIETSSGALYDPKYTGGATVFTPLKPRYQYSTHHYAFNVQKGELPIRLLQYSSRDRKQMAGFFIIKRLISPPLPESTRIVSIGTKIEGQHFSYQVLSYSEDECVVKGPYKGESYSLFGPRSGYKFVLLFIKVTNTGNKVEDAPLYARDGDFSVKTDNGNTYTDISPFLIPAGDYWLKSTSKKSNWGYPLLNDYTFRIYPGESEVLVKAFEIPTWSTPLEFKFRLLGDLTLEDLKEAVRRSHPHGKKQKET